MLRHPPSPLVVAALVFISVSLGAQTSGPGICFSFNDSGLGVASSSLPLVAGGELYLGFTAPVTATIERIDVSIAFPSVAVIAMEVFQESAPGLPASLLAATVASTFPGWTPFSFNPPVTFSAGGGYAFRLTIASGPSSVAPIMGEATATTPLSYLLICGPNPPLMLPACAAYPPLGQFGASIRFRTLSCGPVPLASSTTIPVRCGGGSPFAATISLSAPPVLGTSVGLFATGGPGTVHVFLGIGPATGGLNLGGSGCLLYIDPVSLAALYAAGLAPFVSFPTAGIQTSVVLAIPADPTLAGATLTLQALVTGGFGGLPIAPGLVAQVSNALVVTLGY